MTWVLTQTRPFTLNLGLDQAKPSHLTLGLTRQT